MDGYRNNSNAKAFWKTAEVDGVLAVALEKQDGRRPQPVLIAEAANMERCRGMRLGFERTDVIGSLCSDNVTTENFHQILALPDGKPGTIGYLEFRADYRVALRFDDGRERTIPFVKLTISKLPADFLPQVCQTCVDCANALFEITMGYMGGLGEQWLIVRNER